MKSEDIEFDFKILDGSKDTEIPPFPKTSGFAIYVFFTSANENGLGRHFSVLIHNKDANQIYYFDPLGII